MWSRFMPVSGSCPEGHGAPYGAQWAGQGLARIWVCRLFLVGLLAVAQVWSPALSAGTAAGARCCGAFGHGLSFQHESAALSLVTMDAHVTPGAASNTRTGVAVLDK